MTRRRLSIAALLVAVLVAAVTLLLVSFATLGYRSEAAARRANLAGVLGAEADRVAAALALPMWNLDPTAIRSVAGSAMSLRDVAAVEAVAEGDRLVLARDPQWQPVEAAAGAPPDGRGLLVARREVRHGTDTIGQVRVWVTPRFVEQSLDRWRRTALLLILALDAGLVLSLWALLRWLILKPVKALTQFAAAVERGESPQPPQSALFVGELGQLRRSIGRTIEMLESRYQALLDGQERLQLATSAARIGVWEWHRDTGRLVWDDEINRRYGLDGQRLEGTYETWLAAVSPEDAPQVDASLQAALRDGWRWQGEFRVVRPDGSLRHIRSDAIVTRDARGRATRMVGVSLDITEQRVAEDQIRALNAELEQRVQERTLQLVAARDEAARLRDQAQAATVAKSEFLATMSHEIRTPMNAVLGLTDLVLRGPLEDRQRDRLAKARAAAQSLLGLLNNVLDVSKIEAGRLELDAHPFVVAEVLERVRAVIGVPAQAKGLRLRFDLDAAVPRTLVGDSMRLEQVLVNLCGNAVKFTPEGEVAVTVRRRDSGAPGQIVLQVSVRDSGIGMTPAQLGSLFQPFNQLDPSTSRHYGGSGLGLAICRQLVGLMGGEIGVSSEAGRGSEFHFTAVFEAAPAEAAAVRGEPHQAVSSAALRGRRVLLVEDNELNQMVAAELLREVCGMEVIVAADGAAALQQLARERFDAVLMDVRMPGMDGYETTRRLRTIPAARGLPVIAMTADAMAQDRDRCLDAGMNDFVAKPFDPPELFAVLQKWLGPGPDGPQPAPWQRDEPAQGADVEAGLRRCMGHAALYERVVRRYLAASPGAPAEIAAALSAGAVAQAAQVAHALISTAGTLGANALSTLARDLQALLDAGDAAAARGLMPRLAAEQAAVRDTLQTYLASCASAPD